LYKKIEQIVKTYPKIENLLPLYIDSDQLVVSKNGKYDVDKIFHSRTFEIGLEDILYNNPKVKEQITEYLENKMKQQTILRNHLTLLLSFKTRDENHYRIKNLNLTNTGTERYHRLCGKELGLNNYESDSIFSVVLANIKSVNTWNNKTIKNLENKILELEKN
jgi:hypothetical protein